MAAQSPLPGCVHHQGKRLEFLCKDCEEELLCSKCMVDTHRNHNFVLIEYIVPEKKSELQQYIQKVSNTENAALQENITKTEERIEENGRTFRKIINDIKDQALKLKEGIDKCVDNLVRLCNELEKSNENMLEAHKSALGKLKDLNIRKLDELQKTLVSGTNFDLIEKAKEIRHEPDSPSIPEIKTTEFHPGLVSVAHLEHLLGFVSVGGQDQQYRPVTISRVVSEFTHKSFVDVCRVTKDSAWLSYWKDEDIYRVDQTGNVEETINCKVKVSSIDVSPTTGRVWFCCRDDNTVREVVDRDTIVTRVVTDSKLFSVCTTVNNTVVVGMLGKIQMYNTNGLEVESAGTVGPYKQEAVLPFYMAYSTQTGDVAAVDSDGMSFKDYVAGKRTGKQPHIKMLDKHLNIRFKYPDKETPSTTDDGNAGDTGKSLFFPTDVCFDVNGNILVAEGATKSFILIDGVRAEYLQTIHTDDNISTTISLQTDGTLWVGQNNKKVKIIKCKL